MATSLLLADDSPTIAKILQMALQNEPYEIRAVLNAEDALKELRSRPPFFFLVDLNLPTTNGYEFAASQSRIKSVNLGPDTQAGHNAERIDWLRNHPAPSYMPSLFDAETLASVAIFGTNVVCKYAANSEK